MIIQKIKNIDDHYFDVFMSISTVLTGLSIFELQATGWAKKYYEYLNNNIVGNSFFQFLQDSNVLITQCNLEKSLAEKLKGQNEADAEYQSMAHKIITLWYLGSWEGAYIDANTYKEGLIWHVIHAHPPGAKQPGFKTWMINPEKDYL